MTNREKALKYFKHLRGQKVKDYSVVLDTAPKDSVVYETALAELEIYDIVIKSLEQESILDKIREEIEGLEEGITSYHNDRPWIFKDEALDIIDKYKAEMESD